MEELNKGYEFTKAQIAELESLRSELKDLRAWKAEIERLRALQRNSFDLEMDSLVRENQSLKNEAAMWKQSSQTWADKHDELAESFQCHPNKPVIERLKAELAKATGELEAARSSRAKDALDAERYRHMRANFSVQDRNGPGLYWYLPRWDRDLPWAERLDFAIDKEIKHLKGGV